jgi:hypothetical protein
MLNSDTMGDIHDPEALGGMLMRVLTRPILDLRRLFHSIRPVAVALFSLLLTCVATFRSFGFDLKETIADYPNVAGGWGVWFWLAQQRWDFLTFFFIVNSILTFIISNLAFPAAKEGYSEYRLVQVVTLLYMCLWFLFGQARYGSGVGLIAYAIGFESVPIAIVLFALAFFTHKAVAGGIGIVLLWLILRRSKYGPLIAALICAVVTYAITQTAGALLQFAGYSNYLNWKGLPPANTPYKYLYFAALLVGWLLLAKGRDEICTAKEILILTVLFFPFSLYLVFAGRSYQLYAVILLTLLARTSVPFVVRYLMLIVYVFDIYSLLFRSGCFGATGCIGP